MPEHQDPEGTHPRPASSVPADRLVYVMPAESGYAAPDDEIDPRELWRIVWSGRWRIVGVTIIALIASISYALLAKEWFRAEILLSKTEQMSDPSLNGQFSGLAALAGVTVGSNESTDAVATMKSRDFAREFVRDNQLIPLFFRDLWDASTGSWKSLDPSNWPDERDAVVFFQENILRINEDRKTGLITLAVLWYDPVLAASWATQLVERANRKLRQQALQEAENNISYLKQTLETTAVVPLQQAIGRLIESELQKLMLARGNEEFAFRVIDSAFSPKSPVRPNKKLTILVGTLGGALLGFAWVFITNTFRFSLGGAHSANVTEGE